MVKVKSRVCGHVRCYLLLKRARINTSLKVTSPPVVFSKKTFTCECWELWNGDGLQISVLSKHLTSSNLKGKTAMAATAQASPRMVRETRCALEHDVWLCESVSTHRTAGTHALLKDISENGPLGADKVVYCS